MQKRLQAAPDDAVIEFHGKNLTKAEWRAEFQANYAAAGAKLKTLAEEHRAKFDAAAKALHDEQDADLATQNAQVAKEFEELK